jgi:hypothetical protein
MAIMRRKYLAHLFILSFAMVFVCGCKKQAPAPAYGADVATQVCAHNLEVIAAGKGLWAEKNQKGADDAPTMEDLAVYVRHTPSCPSGGTYTIGKVGELPSCSIADHQTEFVKRMQAPSTNAAP